MKKAMIVLLLFLTLSASAGCTSQSVKNSHNQVYTSVYPVYYLTSRIAENGINVELLMPPSADPHNWEPSPKQMAQLESCRLFIYNGAGLETWASKVGEIAVGNNTACLELASTLSSQLLPDYCSYCKATFSWLRLSCISER
jgi:zinc transport system substrate-binding protein